MLFLADLFKEYTTTYRFIRAHISKPIHPKLLKGLAFAALGDLLHSLIFMSSI